MTLSKNKIEHMHSYDDFPKDVISAFTHLVEKYNLRFKVYGIYSVDITNAFMKINFNMDRYDLQGLLYRIDDSIGFSITRLANHNKPCNFQLEKFPKSEYGDKNSIKNQLSHFAFIIDKHIGYILKGEFDWYDRVKEEDEYESRLIGLILGSEIKSNHPISKKFWSGNKTWKDDIEIYINENNIEIQNPNS